MKFSFNDGGRKAAGYKGQAGDCVCRAIAIASGRPYQEVYGRLSDGNATQRRGRTASNGITTKRLWVSRYMRDIGFAWTATMGIGTGCRVHVLASELPPGRLVLRLSRHWAAFVDGVLCDVDDCSRGGTRCVYGYWRYL